MLFRMYRLLAREQDRIKIIRIAKAILWNKSNNDCHYASQVLISANGTLEPDEEKWPEIFEDAILAVNGWLT